MSYLALKYVHIVCVVASGAGFVLRGYWMLNNPSRMKLAWVRIAPHLIDSALLGSALAMAVISTQYPFVQDWLTAKFFGLLGYILCGTVALKRGRSPAIRASFLVAAIIFFTYIVSVALTRNPLGWLAGL